MKASLQQQPMYCSRDHNYTSIKRNVEDSSKDSHTVKGVSNHKAFHFLFGGSEDSSTVNKIKEMFT